jgi:hypothetical protein
MRRASTAVKNAMTPVVPRGSREIVDVGLGTNCGGKGPGGAQPRDARSVVDRRRVQVVDDARQCLVRTRRRLALEQVDAKPDQTVGVVERSWPGILTQGLEDRVVRLLEEGPCTIAGEIVEVLDEPREAGKPVEERAVVARVARALARAKCAVEDLDGASFERSLVRCLRQISEEQRQTCRAIRESGGVSVEVLRRDFGAESSDDLERALRCLFLEYGSPGHRPPSVSQRSTQGNCGSTCLSHM